MFVFHGWFIAGKILRFQLYSVDLLEQIVTTYLCIIFVSNVMLEHKLLAAQIPKYLKKLMLEKL